MYSKKKIEHIIAKVSLDYIKHLQLKSWTIRFHVINGLGAEAAFSGITYYDRTNNLGQCFISVANKSADIVLYQQNLFSEKAVKKTIFHELLHVLLAKLVDYTGIKVGKATQEEERIIRLLEEFFAKYVLK